MHYGTTSPAVFWLLLSATVLYLTGVMGITIFGNVPLNEALKSFDLRSSPDDETTARRLQFEVSWNHLNQVRTLTSTLALACLIIAYIM